jgi:hypothetical protein
MLNIAVNSDEYMIPKLSDLYRDLKN